MPYVPLNRFLFRAPLLPLAALRDPRAALAASPFGEAALRMASPDLAAALARKRMDARAAAAIGRYARRAAFRPTPSGFWAGVGVGKLGRATRVRTGAPETRVAPTWQRLAAVGRGILEDLNIRDGARLRRAPSLILGARTLSWIAASEGGPAAFATEQQAERDEALEAVVATCATWTPWPAVRARILEETGADQEDGHDLDDWLLTLVDAGLLHVDVVPPLVGPEPGPWLRARLAALPAARAVEADLTTALNAAARGDVAAAEAALARLPGSAAGEPGTAPPPSSRRSLRGDLVFRRGASVTLSRPALDRAAALAPLLFAIQEALAPPGAERTPSDALAGTLDAATETFGAGAFEVSALALGDYGSSPAGSPSDDEPETSSPPTATAQPLLELLTERIVEAAREGHQEIALASADLRDLVDELVPPPTAEVFVTPAGPRPGRPPGHDWLLGLHAPAGASWGRFGAALGDDGRTLLEELAAAERAARPGERALDVAFTPSASHADLCAHPALRDGVLALSAWGDPAGGQPEVTAAELELVADPSALEPLALRAPELGPVAPTPLHRVRSHTAPPGVWRLLAGWSLRRQHAPWALALGPLARLAALPRVSIDGFVVAPASWRVPDDVAAGTRSSRSIRAWRRARRLPRFVQVGHEDELLPVDLDGPTARDDLRGAARVHEIWPPLGDTPDRGGRRVEAIVGIARVPDDAERTFTTAALHATAVAGAVPPPRAAVATVHPGWTTFKVFGAEDRQNDVLVQVVAPAVAADRAAGAVGSWFFQRYVDGPGHRPHLRVRVTGDADAFARRLETAARDARAAGDVVAIERAPYFPETARLGGAAAHAAVHALFEGASELALSLLGSPDDSRDPSDSAPDASARPGDDLAVDVMGTLWLVAAFDRLARAFGLDDDQRRRLAARRRAAHADLMTAELETDLSRELRACRPALRSLLAGGETGGSPDSPDLPEANDAEAALGVYARVARRAVAAISSPQRDDQLLPALLHLDAVRLLGPDRLAELRAYTLWERGLESLAHHPVRPPERPAASNRRSPADRSPAGTTRAASQRPAVSAASSDSSSQGSVNAAHRSGRRSNRGR